MRASTKYFSSCLSWSGPFRWGLQPSLSGLFWSSLRGDVCSTSPPQSWSYRYFPTRTTDSCTISMCSHTVLLEMMYVPYINIRLSQYMYVLVQSYSTVTINIRIRTVIEYCYNRLTYYYTPNLGVYAYTHGYMCTIEVYTYSHACTRAVIRFKWTVVSDVVFSWRIFVLFSDNNVIYCLPTIWVKGISHHRFENVCMRKSDKSLTNPKIVFQLLAIISPILTGNVTGIPQQLPNMGSIIVGDRIAPVWRSHARKHRA